MPTQVILFCMEIHLVRPQNCSAQASTFSQYKHHNTVKAMIGLSPTGIITFILNLYGGNTSGRHIAEKEIIDKINQSEISKTREIASLRIHVERAIGRIKAYKILRNTTLTLCPLLYQILVIISVFCTLNPPLVKN